MEKTLTKDQVKNILLNAPKGADPKQLIKGIVDRGYQIEGLNIPRPKEPEKGLVASPIGAGFSKEGSSDATFKDRFSNAKPTIGAVEKIADFTGGKEISQGLGQAAAQGKNSRMLEETQVAQTNLLDKALKTLREKKDRGEDTSRLESALKVFGEEVGDTGAGAQELLNPNKLTNKQVIGDALQLGTTIVGAGSLPSTAKNVVGAETIGKGIVSGAKEGAKFGGAFGTAQGASEALQNDLSGKEVLKKSALGGVEGGIAGGVLGGVAGGVSGGLKARETAKVVKEDAFVDDLVSPKPTTAVKERAMKEGRVTEAGMLGKSKIIPSKRDKQLAEAVKGYVSSEKPVTENIESVKAGVSKINNGVKQYVKENKVPFNTNQLKRQLNNGKDELNLIFASDSNAEKTYDSVVREFMKHVENKDTEGLLEARQAFDQIPAIKKLLNSQGLGENTRKEVVLTARDMVNRYIADLLPEGNQYRSDLLQESRMIEAIGNMVDKNISMIGKNKLQMLTSQYPILKWIIGGLATAAVGAAGVGVGSAIIGSSD